MKNSLAIRKPGGLMLILIWLAACTPSVSTTSAPMDLIQTERVLNTPIPAQVISPTGTPIPTKSPTPVPLPTLPPEQVSENVVELLKTNAGCQLPCIWGITPGFTSWAEAGQKLQQADLTLSADRQGTSLVHYDSLLISSAMVEEAMFTKIEFIEQNSVVTAIRLHGEGYYSPPDFKKIWMSYAPESIMSNLGSPTRVWIKAVASASEGNPTSFPYELWLFYDPLGLLLRYSGTVDGKPIYQFCPTFSDSDNIGNAIDVYAVSVGDAASPEDLTELATMPYPPRNLEEITKMTIEDFYLLYIQKDKLICFETPQNIWK